MEEGLKRIARLQRAIFSTPSCHVILVATLGSWFCHGKM